ncbi:hypothetical protein RND71_008241 [Anisodus tanguticus]|uniref:Uncharacterized protein n=1 Tax=Anisodus tanguticus TaxID=243964 RepID=A0AAE1SP80_9SOLA|nr:hypothetical protein RND71_008241 [Anisodus tanguticus]
MVSEIRTYCCSLNTIRERSRGEGQSIDASEKWRKKWAREEKEEERENEKKSKGALPVPTMSPTSKMGRSDDDGVLCDQLTAVANPGEVDQVQLDRAKQSTKSTILMNLESRMVASEDIGRQLLTYGERTKSGTRTWRVMIFCKDIAVKDKERDEKWESNDLL